MISESHIITLADGKKVKIIKKAEEHYEIWYKDMLIGLAKHIDAVNDLVKDAGFSDLLEELDE